MTSAKTSGAAHYPGNATPAPARGPATACLLGLCLLLGACGSDRPLTRGAAPQSDWERVEPEQPAAANAVLMRAISLVGTPYRYGGNTPESGFDCSGLVNYVYRDMLDIRLPRTSSALSEYQGPRIASDELAAADLVFFSTGGRVTHVGIYVGDGRFVHAPSTGGTVRLDSLDGYYWRDHYSGARRVLD